MEPYPHSCSQLASVINFISPDLSLSGYYGRQIKFLRIYIKNLADIELTVYINLNLHSLTHFNKFSVNLETRVFAFRVVCIQGERSQVYLRANYKNV